MPVLQQQKPVTVPDSSSPDTRAPDIPALTSLRFFLSLIVVLIHYKKQVADFGVEVPVEHLSNVVTGFFLLSGFLLTYQYAHRGWHTKSWSFWRARFARIFPVYWFFLTIALTALPLAYFIPDKSLWTTVIVSNFLLMQAFFTDPNIYFGLIPPAYTLSTEVMFYFLFPFVMLSFHKWRSWLGLSVLAAISLPIAASIMNDSELIVYVFGPCPLTRFIEFLSGILMAKLYFRFKDHPSNSKLIPFMETFAYATCLYFACQPFGNGTFLAIVKGGPFALFLLNRVLAIAGYGMLIWALACQKGVSHKLLSGSLLVFLGESSYALFLFHDLIVRFIAVHRENLSLISNEYLFAIYMIASIGLSCLALVLVERPWRRWLLTSHSEESRRGTGFIKYLSRPVAGTAALACLIVTAAYNADTACMLIAECKSLALAETKDIAFGRSLTLKKSFYRDCGNNISLHFKWRSQEEATKARFLSVSCLDAGGRSLWDSTKSLDPPSGIWFESFTIPREKFLKTRDVAICVSDKTSAMLVASGRRDWSERRLLAAVFQGGGERQ